MVEPKKNELSVLATDTGPEFLPKLYRRYTSLVSAQQSQRYKPELSAVSRGGTRRQTGRLLRDLGFLANGVHSATHRTLDQFINAGKTINFQPDGLVFSEAPSKLVGSDDKPITQF